MGLRAQCPLCNKLALPLPEKVGLRPEGRVVNPADTLLCMSCYSFSHQEEEMTAKSSVPLIHGGLDSTVKKIVAPSALMRNLK